MVPSRLASNRRTWPPVQLRENLPQPCPPPSSSHQMRSRASLNRNADVANPPSNPALSFSSTGTQSPDGTRAGAAAVIPQLWTHLLAKVPPPCDTTLVSHPSPCSGQAMGGCSIIMLFNTPHDLHSTRTESFFQGWKTWIDLVWVDFWVCPGVHGWPEAHTSAAVPVTKISSQDVALAGLLCAA